MGGKPSLPGAACSALGGSGGAPRVVLLGRGSSFPLPPRKARDTHENARHNGRVAVWRKLALESRERAALCSERFRPMSV